MDLRQFRYVVMLGEECHFGRAAARLNIVPSALSNQIRQLEEELGGPLFIRTSRHVTMTDAGRVLAAEGKRVLDLTAQVEHAVLRSIRGQKGRVRIGVTGSIALSARFAADLSSFRKAYPDVELIVRESEGGTQIESIRAGTLDIGYMPNSFQATEDLLIKSFEPVCWAVAMNESHALASIKQVSIKMLANQPLIVFGSRELGQNELKNIHAMFGGAPSQLHRVDSALTVLALAASGIGLSLVPSTMSRVSIPGLVFRPIENSALAIDTVVVRCKTTASEAAKTYLEYSNRQSGELRG